MFGFKTTRQAAASQVVEYGNVDIYSNVLHSSSIVENGLEWMWLLGPVDLVRLELACLIGDGWVFCSFEREPVFTLPTKTARYYFRQNGPRARAVVRRVVKTPTVCNNSKT